ncbi:GDSL esterase/lipase At5g03610-like isoform X2 [Tripterygium wilfordii]|uniref:GDSL esterase/lipase At5g03610-like isoform X2 n=1 Tax=Tripterygium wilfordii TaxID=458696 RepID=UPI0018F818FD|nr:GDSL esterase/lipase At5g03610-like isoform X2 [Tripterygium wilfordii]
MGRQICILCFCLFFCSSTLLMLTGVDAVSVKLFVFGDSYADTGNWRKSGGGPWKEPYGITYPGEPAGRFSNGRVLSDYIASFLGIQSPLPFQLRDMGKPQNGMNFAYGGTGVFDTLASDQPNMTTQIKFFQQLLEENVFTKQDLNSSIALVSLAGNDYGLSKSVIEQLTLNLKTIHDLGVPKIAVTSVEPMGCLPQVTASSSYQNCSEGLNSVSQSHNKLLQQAVDSLNKEMGKPIIQILDLYNAFWTTLFNTPNQTGSMEVGSSLLKPCCVGVSSEYSCGNVDQNGGKKYEVCKNPESSFFWDIIHPSQNGWNQVFSALQATLSTISTTQIN